MFPPLALLKLEPVYAPPVPAENVTAAPFAGLPDELGDPAPAVIVIAPGVLPAPTPAPVVNEMGPLLPETWACVRTMTPALAEDELVLPGVPSWIVTPPATPVVPPPPPEIVTSPPVPEVPGDPPVMKNA